MTAATQLWVADKSALVRLSESTDFDDWFDRVDRGLVRVTTATLLEMGYSVRNGDDWEEMMADELSQLPVENMTPRLEARALQIQGTLAARGQHRAPSASDLIIAAVAEHIGATVLHVDKDFDLIAEVTGQPVERLRL